MARTRIISSSRRRRRLGSRRMETSRSSASSTGRKKLSLRKKRSRMDLNKAKKYLIGGAAAAFVLLVAVLLIVLRPGTYIIETGNISFSVNSTGVMIRNETLYSAEGYRKTEFLAEEGQNLSQGSPIADVYSSDYSEKDYQDLKELQEKILDYQQSNAQTGIIDEDMKALDEQIRNKTEQIRKVITREAQGNLQNLQREIAQLMDERANIMRNASIEDTQLSEFYAQEKELLNRIQNYKKTIVAEKNGIVSFYFDGTENILTPGNLDKLTVKSINDIVNGKFTDTMEGSGAKPLYRMVERNEWYIALVFNKPVPEFENKGQFTLSFSFGNDYTYDAEIYGHYTDAKKEIYIFRSEEDVDKLIRARRVECTVSARYTGLLVDEKSVKEVNGQKGIYVDYDGKKTFEPVIILTTEDGKALIQAANEDSPLHAGHEIYK